MEIESNLRRNLGKKALIFPILYMVFIFILSSIPVDSQDKLGGVVFIKPDIQNLLHIPLFIQLTILWMKVFNNKGLGFKEAALYTLIITISYSALDEFHQYFIPGRYASISDFLLDAFSCVGTVAIYRRIYRWA